MQPPSPGGPAGAQPWQVDLDWLWGTPPGNDGSPATLRLDVVGPGAARAAAAWLGSLPGDEDGVRGRGGWRADPGEQPDADDHAVLLLTSAGEDVADGLERRRRRRPRGAGRRRGPHPAVDSPAP